MKKDLDRVYGSALDQFKKVSGEFPDKIVIFRDGVSHEMRIQIVDNEIK